MNSRCYSASSFRRVFNQGLPEQFSFVTTFRNRNRGRGRRWHLIRITDSRGQPQFAVGLDPNRKTVEFSIKKYDGSLQTLSWERPQVSTVYLLFYRDFQSRKG